MNDQLSIVDTHVHFFDLRHPVLRYDWLTPDAIHPILGNIDSMKSLRYDIENVWAEARFAAVDAFVHIQAAIGSADPVDETRWLTEMRQNHEIPFTIVAHADLGQENALETLARHAESPYLVGIRDFGTEAMLASGGPDEVYERSMAQLVARELVFDLDCEWPNMQAAYELAMRHPDLPIVLEHIGYPRRRDDDYFASWRGGIEALAKAANVTCKLSGLGMTDPRFTPDSLRRWAQVCIDAFSPARLVVGSNWPVDRLFSSYDAIMAIYRTFLAELSESEQRAVLSENARALYRL